MSVYPPTASARDIWEYPTRTLTEYKRTVSVIKNKDYASAMPEDFVYANIVRACGYVTVSELAGFIDYGVANLNLQETWGGIFNFIPFTDDLADIFNDPSLAAANIAKILRSRNMSNTDKIQAILYTMVDKGYYDKVINILTFDAPDESISANTTYASGVNRRRNLSIASAVTLTLGAAPGVIIADTITNNGTINSGWIKGAGGSAPSGAGAGGGGMGAIILIARNISIGTVSANGVNGASGTTTDSVGSGGTGGAGLFWVRSGDTVPNGGKGGGYGVSGGAGNPNGGGGGGSATDVYKGGAGGSATVTAFTSGQALVKELLKCAVDWWLQNVIGKTPTSVKSFPSLGGSGGGGGAANDTYAVSGGGGGGGGEIIVIGMNVSAGTLNAIGGNGGNGGTEGGYDSGGGGGGGGVCYVFYKSLTGTMTFNVAGGAGGTGDYNGTAGGAGIGVTEVI